MIRCGRSAEDVSKAVAAFFWETQEGLVVWLQSQLAAQTHPCERTVIEGKLEILQEFSARQRQTGKNRLQLALL